MPILSCTRPKLQYWSKKAKETLPDLVTIHRIYLWVFSQLKRNTLNHIIFVIKTLDQMKRNLNHYLNLRRPYDVSMADVTYVSPLCVKYCHIFSNFKICVFRRPLGHHFMSSQLPMSMMTSHHNKTFHLIRFVTSFVNMTRFCYLLHLDPVCAAHVRCINEFL